MKKAAIVTGASSGIGRETALKEDWDKILDLNVRAPFLLMQKAMHRSILFKSGRIYPDNFKIQTHISHLTDTKIPDRI